MGIKGNVTTQRESLGTQKGMKMSENRTENVKCGENERYVHDCAIKR